MASTVPTVPKTYNVAPDRRHPFWHLTLSSLFFLQACGMTAYFFQGYRVSKEKNLEMTSWLLYGGITSVLMLVLTLADIYFGLETLSWQDGQGETEYKWVAAGVIFFLGAVGLVGATGALYGDYQFRYPDAASMSTDAAKTAAAFAENMMKWGVGLGATICFVLSLGIMIMKANQQTEFVAKSQFSAGVASVGQTFGQSLINLGQRFTTPTPTVAGQH